MHIGRLLIEWVWKTKWIKPQCGLGVGAYKIGGLMWHDGCECKVVRIRRKRIKIKSIEE